jgi:Cys-tRNA(Pro)/Cys-tRNA(Cys) deacylase
MRGVAAIKKTQAMRILEAAGFPYTVREYDASGLFHTGEEAATILGVDPAVVYKTLVVVPDGGSQIRPLLVLIPVGATVQLKALAQATGVKRLRMATQREAERLTGMRVGGITAIGVPRHRFDVLIDESALDLQTLHVSAGVRGADLELAVEDLLRVTGARAVRAIAAGEGSAS